VSASEAEWLELACVLQSGEGAAITKALTTAMLERKTGVARSTIHFYIRQGLIPKPQKTEGGRLLYSQDHVDLLLTIGELKRGGLTLSQIKASLDERVDQVREKNLGLAERENERTRAAIIEVGVEEFLHKGYRRTHVADIIARLGINPQTFYAHFPSKLHFLAECFRVFIQKSVESVEREMEEYPDPAERALRRIAVGFRSEDLGSTLSAAIRTEGRFDDLEQFRLPETLGTIVSRITEEIASCRPPDVCPSPVADELLAYGLLGAHRYQSMRASWGRGLGTADFLRAHLFQYLAVLAAVRGEIDIAGRLADYESLIQEVSESVPELPPTFES